MADHVPHVPLFPLPTDEQASALRIAADYLSRGEADGDWASWLPGR